MIWLSMEEDGAPNGTEALLSRVTSACCAEEGLAEAAVSARIVGDQEIRRVNRMFRQIDRVTDVLSFPSLAYASGKTARDMTERLSRERDPESGLAFLGDFVISLPAALRQAAQYGHSAERELAYLSAHAMFHLMGYDHETEAGRRAMREKEERALSALNLRREE